MTGDCPCGNFGTRDVTVTIAGGDIRVVHVHCGRPVYVDMSFLMSEPMPMTLTYIVDHSMDKAYQVLSGAGTDSAEPPS